MTPSAPQHTDDLRGQLEKLELALNAIVESIAWVDQGGRIHWCNAPFCHLIGHQKSEVVGARLIELLPLTEDGRPIAREAHPVSLSLSGQPNAVRCYEFQRDDQQLLLEILAARIQFSKHEMSTVVAIRDITERKRAQAMLLQAEKMAALGQLASGIAHEVKNPLGQIMQGVNYLELELVADHHSGVPEVLAMIKEAVMRSDQIVRDLLNFARPAPLTQQHCDMNDILHTSLGLVEKQLAVKHIHAITQLDQGLPLALVDENQMKQVFINIIINAIHAMSDGGTLTLRTMVTRLTELDHGVGRRVTDLFPLGTQVILCEITDTGRGIPKAILSKIFDPFFTTKPPGEGTGLGLAVTQAMIERHHGLIRITSTEGQGTTVKIFLPIPPSTRDASSE